MGRVFVARDKKPSTFRLIPVCEPNDVTHRPSRRRSASGHARCVFRAVSPAATRR
jgi:hypothetical protein